MTRVDKIRGLQRRGLTALLAAAMLVVASACGSEGDDKSPTEATPPPGVSDSTAAVMEELYDSAKNEGALTWYVAANSEPLAKKTADAFMERYPAIKVDVLRLATGPMMARFATEAESGTHQADVLTVGSADLFSSKPDLFVPFDKSFLPVSEDWPSKYAGKEFVAYLAIPWDLGYNTNLVSEQDVPQDWDDVLDPKWKGKIVFGDPRATPSFMFVYATYLRTFGADFLAKLGSQDLILVDSMTPGNQLMASGGAAIGIPGQEVHLNPLIDEGAPLAFKPMGPPFPLTPLFASLPADAPHPNAAKLFMNWFLSPEGMNAECTGGGFVNLNPAIEAEACRQYPTDDKDVFLSSGAVTPEEQAEILRLLRIEG